MSKEEQKLKSMTNMAQQTVFQTLQSAKIAVSFDSQDEAIKALCLAVFGAEPIYPQESEARKWLDKRIKDALQARETTKED